MRSLLVEGIARGQEDRQILLDDSPLDRFVAVNDITVRIQMLPCIWIKRHGLFFGSWISQLSDIVCVDIYIVCDLMLLKDIKDMRVKVLFGILKRSCETKETDCDSW
jgi:hypothetical protein